MQQVSAEEKQAQQRAKQTVYQREYRRKLRSMGLAQKRKRTPEQLARNKEYCKAYREKNRERINAENRARQEEIRRARGVVSHAEQAAATKAKKDAEAEAKRKKAASEYEVKRRRLAREKQEREELAHAKRIEREEAEAALAKGGGLVVRPLADPTPKRTVMSLWAGKRMPAWLKAQVAASQAADAVIESQSLRPPSGRRPMGPSVIDGLPLAGRTADLFPIYAGITRPSRTLALPEWGGKVRCSLKVTAEDVLGDKVVFLPTYQEFKPEKGFGFEVKSCRMKINGMKGLALWLTPRATT